MTTACRRVVEGLALAVLVGAILAGGASGARQVVGGTTIQVQAAPWTVFVEYDFGPMEEVCTGSVIDASHVLTAAHCLFDPSGVRAQPFAVSVEAGISNFSAPLSTDAEQRRSVSSFRVHPGYAPTHTVVADDVAVLALVTPLDLSGPAVRAVALPAPNSPFPEAAPIEVAGFGLQDATAPYASGALESMTGAVDPQGQCGEATGSTLMLSDNAVLVCLVSPASAICSGDSGSGVVTTGAAPVLVGVADGGPTGCPVGSRGIAAYVGAPELLRFIQGEDVPPIAPRRSGDTDQSRLDWGSPLVVGDTLTCSTSGWTGSVEVSYAFVEWKGGSLGKVLQTGSSATYPLPRTAVATNIVCVVAVTNAGGTALVESDPTPSVDPVPQVRIETPGTVTSVRGRMVTLNVVLVSPPGLSGTFSVCGTLPPPVGGRACRSTQKAFGAHGTFTFPLSFRVKPTAPLGISRIAVAAVAGLATAKATALLRVVATQRHRP